MAGCNHAGLPQAEQATTVRRRASRDAGGRDLMAQQGPPGRKEPILEGVHPPRIDFEGGAACYFVTKVIS